MHRHRDIGRRRPRAWLVGRIAPLLVLATACDSGLGPRSADFPLVPRTEELRLADSVRAAYREDAARLAARRVGASSPDVELPPALVESLYAALLRVYALHHPARDSVVAVHPIHTFPSPPLHDVLLLVDPGAKWLGAWRRGESRTGNGRVDELMDRYHLKVQRYYAWPFGDGVVLRSADTLNVAALARRFADIDGIRSAEPDGIGGDGNDIRAEASAAGWRLEYSIGFGDCPAGCIGRHAWSFLVGSDGSVSYLGSTGPEPPRRGGP